MSTNNNNLVSSEKQRAANAAKCIQENSNDVKYIGHAKSLGTLILSNGLAQTIAFLKTKNEYKKLEEDLSNYVTQRLNVSTNLLNYLLAVNTTALNMKLATDEALAWAVWLKRFAQAQESKGKKEEKNETSSVER